jgi:hypothetical protein
LFNTRSIFNSEVCVCAMLTLERAHLTLAASVPSRIRYIARKALVFRGEGLARYTTVRQTSCLRFACSRQAVLGCRPCKRPGLRAQKAFLDNDVGQQASSCAAPAHTWAPRPVSMVVARGSATSARRPSSSHCRHGRGAPCTPGPLSLLHVKRRFSALYC